jgi:hypothetical protein
MMSQDQIDNLLSFVCGVKDDVTLLRTRLAALEGSHRSLCKSFDSLEESHEALNALLSSEESVLAFSCDENLGGMLSHSSRFAVPSCFVKVDGDCAAA